MAFLEINNLMKIGIGLILIALLFYFLSKTKPQYNLSSKERIIYLLFAIIFLTLIIWMIFKF